MPVDNLPFGTRVVSRQQWGAARPTGSFKQNPPPKEAFIHWSGSARAEEAHGVQAQCAVMRGYQRHHQQGNGWSDIGYHFVVFQPWDDDVPGAASSLPSGDGRRLRGTRAREGSIMQGRLVSSVPAAQMGHNAGTLAICVDAGPGDAIKRRTLYLVESLITQYPTIKLVGAHGDVVNTDCPGPELYRLVDRIAAATGRRRYPKSRG